MRRPSLYAQILAVNSLLMASAVLAAVAADQLLVLLGAILATVLGNALVLRRRFAPLERLIETMERVNLSEPGVRATLDRADSQDVVRLHQGFNRMLGRLEEERARAAHAVLRAQEDERARLARDLHDEANQALTAVLLRLEASLDRAPPQLREELRETKAVTTQAMQELLGLARELRPAALDDHGLDVALRAQAEQFSRRTGIAAYVQIEAPTAALSADQQLVVYRVVQESLSNVAQHSGARHVWIEVARHGGRIGVRVADDGQGFDAAMRRAASDGLGLPGMRERALLAGARLEVRSRLGAGTTVELRIGAG
jgi:two-component system sensor histidine kinase UhpB